MPDDIILDGLTSRQAVEEIAHEIRTRQLSILSLVQLLRHVNSGDVDIDHLPAKMGVEPNLAAIQQCVHEISDLMDVLVDFVRENDELSD
ncbi:MAG: hypothetical protein ACFE0Q_03000 [Anaerolineae bacterium]